MKRYSFGLDSDANWWVFESKQGDYYHRDDLIAAGCLVPAPVGKPCRPHDCGMFMVDGKVFDAYGVSAVDGTMPKCPDFVQPVRLVPLAELEGE